jgi:hypothetical protein
MAKEERSVEKVKSKEIFQLQLVELLDKSTGETNLQCTQWLSEKQVWGQMVKTEDRGTTCGDDWYQEVEEKGANL